MKTLMQNTRMILSDQKQSAHPRLKKRIFYFFFIILILNNSGILAQTFGIKAGLNFPSMLIRDDDEVYSENKKLKLGIHIGGSVDYEIMENFSFEGGLLISLKGMRMTEEDEYMGFDYKAEMNTNLTYLLVPVTAKYKYNLNSFGIYGLAGPYLGTGLGGKVTAKVEINGDEETEDEPIDWGNDADDDDLRRLDGGLIIGAGVIIENIQAGLSYELGVLNISSDTDNGTRVKNRALSITVVYFFNK